MRFMVMVKTKPGEEGPPTSEQIADMGRFNEELVQAGVVTTGEGLMPSSMGAKVRFSKSGTTVIDGPFSEAKELVGGFWIFDVKSKEEALDWVRKIPFDEGEVEVRQIAEVEDFAVDEVSAEALEKEREWRDKGWRQPQ
ncbi:MAG TPA: YciI family protein [Devosiaceae bacterium]|nr:YciI family protein [Devosiaceae bacterium]